MILVADEGNKMFVSVVNSVLFNSGTSQVMADNTERQVASFYIQTFFTTFHSMKGKDFILITLLMQGVFSPDAFAQITGPEQDCIGAIPVCQTVFVQSQSYQGAGVINDISAGSSCLGNEENNSVWYTFTITVAGVLEFSIVPQAGDDYDFALFNLTGASCNDIFIGTPGIEVRCNYAFTTGTTGLQTGFSGQSSGPGGVAFLAPINVSVGERYVLVVDNFSSTASGYTIDFAPSANTTASISENVPPVLDSIVPVVCQNPSFLTAIFSKPVACNSLQADGSNFSLSGPAAVTVTGSNCPAGATRTAVQLNLSAPIMTAGTYTLLFNSSVNGLTLEDACGNAAVLASDTFTFYANEGIQASFSFNCISDTIEFINTSVDDSLEIFWTFGDGESSTEFSPLHAYAFGGNYPVSMTASNSSCAVAVTETVGVYTNFFVGFNYPPIATHPGLGILFTNASTYNSSVVYSWSFGDGETSAERHPVHVYTNVGTYTVCLITTAGCYVDTLCKVLEITDDTTSLAPPLDRAIEIFPNPVEDVLEVRMEHNTRAVTYSLFNYLGVKLLTDKSSSNALELHMGAFPAGVYFLKIESGKSFAVKEIIKL